MWEGNKSPILGLRSKRRVHIVVVDNLASIVLASQKWTMFVVNSYECYSFLYSAANAIASPAPDVKETAL